MASGASWPFHVLGIPNPQEEAPREPSHRHDVRWAAAQGLDLARLGYVAVAVLRGVFSDAERGAR